MARPPAEATQQLETEDVRVTRWDFAPGSETGHHRHEFDYVVVPLTNGRLDVEVRADAKSAIEVVANELQIGASYNRSAGVEHNVVNNGVETFSFVEIELLNRPG